MLRLVGANHEHEKVTAHELDDILRLSDRPVFNIKAVEQATEVLASTLRAWERRYGILAPQRTESGYRLYSERDVAVIRWLKQQLAQGMTISHAAALLTTRVAEKTAPRNLPYVLDASPLAAMRARLTDALLRLDEAEANHILSDAFSRYAIEVVCLELLQPLLVDVGAGWAAGEVSIAQEHFATHWVRQKLLGLMAATPQRHTGRPIITASAPTDQHELGVLFVALFLQRAGYDVIHLGPNLAADGLSETLTTLRPSIVAISATHAEGARRIQDIAAEIRRMPEPRPILAFGGQAFNLHPELGDQIDGIFLGRNAHEVIANVERLVRASEGRAKGA